MLLLEDKMQTDAKQFMVLQANDLLGLEARYYSRHPERYAFLVAPHWQDGTTRGLINLGQYSQIRFWTIDDLKAHARESTLVDPARATVAALERAGYKVTGRVEGCLQVVSLE